MGSGFANPASMEHIEILALASQLSRSFKFTHFKEALERLVQGERIEKLRWSEASVSELFHRNLDQLKRRRDVLKAQGLGHCFPGHPHYPQSFLVLSEPPLCLLVRGSTEALKLKGVSVVGSRNPHQLSGQWLDEHFGEFLAEEEEVCVISGGARGIDQQAHRLALRKQRPTLIFCPSGLNAHYPKDLAAWTERVLEGGGAFISEYWLDQRMRSFHFLQRNRMIAALGAFLVVVEARQRSGSQMTARLAADQGREVAVVPSHPKLIQMRGSLDLIRSGAHILVDAKDLKYLWRCTSQTLFVDPNI